MCVVSVHVVGFCCWMFRGMRGLVNYIKNTEICRNSLGEVLGALGAPLGTQGGPKSGF